MRFAKALGLALGLALGSAPTLSLAGYIPKKNFEHQPVTLLSGKPASAAQVREAIVRGGVIRGWRLREVEPGKFEAFLDVRAKHQLTMDILYKDGEFSLIYKSSNIEKGDKIHDKYELWSTNLIKDIQGEAYKLDLSAK